MAKLAIWRIAWPMKLFSCKYWITRFLLLFFHIITLRFIGHFSLSLYFSLAGWQIARFSSILFEEAEMCCVHLFLQS